ncbi:hypothetical protein Tco_1186697 [Tanacetum coccineum]
MIGSLMYLTASRPDIMFAVCACARFQVTLKTSHLLAIKRIFRYLKGKPTLGLWYSRDSLFELVAYTDSDYAGATQDRKPTTGGCQFLGNRLISWQCKKQTVVATSTTEAEYVVAASYLLTKGFDAGRIRIKEERLARKQEEEANIALIESWDNKQAMMEADFKLAHRLQTEEQGEITIKERSRLFIELMNKRKKHFAMLRAEEKRRKPPTKAQKRNLMSTYLKNIGGYKHNQLKSKSYEEIQKLFDSEIRRVNTFLPMDFEVVKSKKETEESSKGIEDELESNKSKKTESSKEKAKGSRKKILGKKRAGKEQQQESSKRQRMEDDKETDEHEEVKVDDEAELKKNLVIVKDDDISIDAIPLATKPLVIVEYKLLKEGILVHYQLIRADRSSKRYSSMIRMLQDIDREDLETLWKLVKTKHGDIRPKDEHERVLLGDLKVMFEPDIKSEVWRNL